MEFDFAAQRDSNGIDRNARQWLWNPGWDVRARVRASSRMLPLQELPPDFVSLDDFARPEKLAALILRTIDSSFCKFRYSGALTESSRTDGLDGASANRRSRAVCETIPGPSAMPHRNTVRPRRFCYRTLNEFANP